MKAVVLAVLDKKIGGYAYPFTAQSKGQGMRMFGDWSVDPNVPISRHPEDYALYLVGHFDDESGALEGLNHPEYMCTALDFVKPSSEAQGPRPVKSVG